ncbi:MAG TPA: S9 family peptidase [Pyrinomonadaceae bacterium]|nr:S9 family peptidase [Pyrinomonadaceae bacterium]
MSTVKTAPYGSWKSPVTSDLIVTDSVGLGQIALDGGDVYWLEMRPSEGGRTCLVRRDAAGRTSDVTPQGFNARTRVHEYGGGDFVVSGRTLFFSNFADQRLYRQDREDGEGGGYGEPRPVTPGGPFRYADACVDRRRARLVCVREEQAAEGSEPINTIVSIDADGAGNEGGGHVLAAGHDFYAAPRLSPDGRRLAWLSWDHPNMPWDGCELWVAELDEAGQVSSSRLIAGGPSESVAHPCWSPAGVLYFVSDRNNWWNLYREAGGGVECVYEAEAEFGYPLWVFGLSTYAFAGEDEIVCAYNVRGRWALGRVTPSARSFERIETPYTDISYVNAGGGRAVFRAASPAERAAVVSMDLRAGGVEVLRRSSETQVDPGYVSEAEAIEFPGEGGRTAHAFFYRPRNRDFVAPEGERPPLLVKCHGGPTSATTAALRLEVQFWTSRGVAVLDVNYGGSTGYGREYRDRLEGAWGIVDVDDCVSGARRLVERGEVDGERCAISGGSAGGFTVLNALTFRDLFRAGASHYGVSDLKGLVADTHKFESRYLDRLVGPYPERADLYYERSSINFTERLSCPVIFFQGLEDRVVPPSQAEMMVEALRRKKLPVAYVAFEGEQHGFRKAENIKRALDGELYFYSRVFGFELAEAVEPVPVENL